MKTTIAFGIVLAVLRIWIGMTVKPDSFEWVQVYKDVAHLFMGGLFVASRFQKQEWQTALFWGLIVLEVSTAILSRLF